MSKLRDIALTIVSTIFVSILFGQNKGVEWGELEKKNGSLVSILPKRTNDFFAFRNSGLFQWGNEKITSHENFKRTLSQDILLQVKDSLVDYKLVDVLYLRNRLIVFLSYKNDLYKQEYGENLFPIGNNQKIITNVTNIASYEGFKVIQSPDLNSFCISWAESNMNKLICHYQVFDDQCVLLYEGVSNTRHYAFESFLSNDRSYFFISSIPNENSTFIIKLTHVYYQSVIHYSFGTDVNLIESLNFNSNKENIISLSGSYILKGGGLGVYQMSFDYKNQNKINEYWTDLTGKYHCDYAKMTKIKPVYAVLKNTYLTNDGGLIGLVEMEFNYNISPSTNYSYYLDIICFKIGKAGEVEWVKLVEKNQLVRDHAMQPFSSAEDYLNGDRLCIIFNDNVKNYDQNGKFMKQKKLYVNDFKKSKNILANVEINIYTGDLERTILTSTKDIGTYFTPESTQINEKDKQLIIYTQSAFKERFGIINFK